MIVKNIIQPISRYYLTNEIIQLTQYVLANKNLNKKQKLASANARINELKQHR